jgi:hypothetical protein
MPWSLFWGNNGAKIFPGAFLFSNQNESAKIINSLIIMLTLIHKIPPNLPLQREEVPLFGKEGLALLNSGHASRLEKAI